jgi:hypothetical protein
LAKTACTTADRAACRLPPGSGEITGPFSQIYYYDYNQTPAAFSTTYVPAHNSGQISQVIDGTVTIDDNDTPAGTDDRISFTVTLTSPLGGDIIRYTGDKVVDKYTSMTQALAPNAVDSATANAFGGYDYVIGSEGFPTLLTFNSPTEPRSRTLRRTAVRLDGLPGFVQRCRQRSGSLVWSHRLPASAHWKAILARGPPAPW